MSALPPYNEGLPAQVVRAMDAAFALGASLLVLRRGRTVVSVLFMHVPEAALPVLTELRGALCGEHGEWTWTPDRSTDCAAETQPFANHLHLLRAS